MGIKASRHELRSLHPELHVIRSSPGCHLPPVRSGEMKFLTITKIHHFTKDNNDDDVEGGDGKMENIVLLKEIKDCKILSFFPPP